MLLHFICIGPEVIQISYCTANINIKCPHSYQPMAGNIISLVPGISGKSWSLAASQKLPWLTCEMFHLVEEKLNGANHPLLLTGYPMDS